MILEVRINNYKTYSDETKLVLYADKRIRKLPSNVHREKGFKALKSACVYGANNSGKSCLIGAMKSIKSVLLNQGVSLPTNITSGSKTCAMGISFLYGGKAYSYDFKYDSSTASGFKRGFVYERLSELSVDKDDLITDDVIFLRDVEKGEYVCPGSEDLCNSLRIFSTNNILIYTVNTSLYPIMGECKQILTCFASGIDILNMNNIPINKTITALKYDEPIKKKIRDFIRKADLEIENFDYLKGRNSNLTSVVSDEEDGIPNPVDIALRMISAEDTLRLISVHDGKSVQSVSFDSSGTQKTMALASYIIEAIEKGRTLIVDELDNSLHFRLAKEIVSLFNDERNERAQLIFTAHETALLDCNKIFREDQVWFVNRDTDSGHKHKRLVPLLEYEHLNEDRSRKSVSFKYMNGDFGTLPEPDFSRTVFSGNMDKDDTDE